MCLLRAHQAQQQAQQQQHAQQSELPQPSQPQAQAGGIAGLQLQTPEQLQAPSAPPPQTQKPFEVIDEEEIPVLTAPIAQNTTAKQAPAKTGLEFELKDVSEDEVEIDLALQFEAVRHSPRMAELRSQEEQELLRGLALKGRRDRFEIFTRKMIITSIGGLLASLLLAFVSAWLIPLAAIIIVLTTAIRVMSRKKELISRENQVDIEPVPVRVEQISRSHHRMAILGLDIHSDEAPADFVPIQESKVERLIGINISFLSKKSFRTGDMAILVADDGYALILDCFEFQQIARMAKSTEEFQRRYQKMVRGR